MTAEPALTHRSAPLRNRWLLSVIIAGGSTASYLDRATLAVIVPLIRRDLSLTPVDYSFVLNAFLFSYTVFYLVGGRLSDRFGYRRMFSISLGIWSVATILHAAVFSRLQLILVRTALGIGEGCYFPTAVRALTTWFDPVNRAKAMAILLCGSSAGMILSSPVVSWLTVHFGWRTTFFATGLLSAALLPLWAWFWKACREPHEIAPSTGHEAGTTSSLGKALIQRPLFLLLLARALTDAVWFFYVFWLPSYFQDQLGYSLTRSGWLLSAPYLFADAGAFAGAWAIGLLVRRGWSIVLSRRVVWSVSVALFLVGSIACLLRNPLAQIALVSLSLFGHMSWGTNLQTAITEASPRVHLGSVFGISGASGAGVGAIAQLAFGRMVMTGSYKPAFVTCAALYAISLSCVLLAYGKRRSSTYC